MRKTQQGFTLIELIMVIVIIGILASVALPRFYDMQTDARSAKAEAIYGAVRSASAIVHSAALVKGRTSASGDPDIVMEGSTSIGLAYGYPTAAGIASAANIVTGQDGITVATTATTATFTLDGVSTPANCSVTYTQVTATGGAPGIVLKNNKSNPAGSCS